MTGCIVTICSKHVWLLDEVDECNYCKNNSFIAVKTIINNRNLHFLVYESKKMKRGIQAPKQ